MAAFAIMRCKKLSSMGSVAGALKHCFRERETPNADPERTPTNDHLATRSTDEAMGRLRALLPEKRRKDAVLAVEYVMTASPAWWHQASPDQQQEFLDRSLKWLIGKYGAQNVLAATIHRDEATPHLSAFVIPKTADGRLSAKEFIGDKKKMSLDQTSFAECMKDLGIERGIEGSKSKHQRVKTHYAYIQRPWENAPTFTADELKPQKIKGETITEKLFGVKESELGVVERLNAKVEDAWGTVAEKAALATQERQRSRQTQDTLTHLQNRLQGLEKPLQGLSAEQVRKVMAVAEQLQRENAQAQEKRQQARPQGRPQGRGGR